ncbi:cyclophilin-like fold protein [Sphingobacterium mizutaii]|uniref:cyclophilin-like fold protein n=1 Tax=Sphingobacterium mizutaii TaxID=1010 RepID=UPI0016284274|nr:cyclophilin-like fold protein [Sphingobacterium mizutaii]
MKHSLILILAFMSIFISSASSCGKEDENNTNTENTTSMANGKIKITVNSLIFTATLLDNNSAKAFKEMLPLTINMVELNNNEKYFDLPNSLPTNSSNPQAINSGDLMLYGSKTLVLFYKTFSTSYSYTRLGKIDDTTGLATALGSGNVTITINKIED